MQGIRISANLLYLLAGLLLLIGYFLNLGVQPLYMEEPRRSIIAMELLENHNWWVPTLIGEYYYNKPPFYNWILIGFEKLLGGFSEFNLRLPTVLATFGIAGLMYGVVKKQLQNEQLGFLSALLFLTASGILLFFSMLAEIDMVYSLIVFAGMLAIFHFGEKERYWPLFLLVYLSCALGVLTKGLPSFVFTAVSLLLYFIDKKRFKALFHPAHFAGIGLLGLVLFAYYYQYAQYHDLSRVWIRMLTESGDRTVVNNSWSEFFTHLIVFPLNWVGDMAPASLLLVFLWRKDWKTVLLSQNSFIRFCTLMLVFNALPYWISPGTRMRYVYMLYPLACIVLAWVYHQRQTAPSWTGRVFRIFALIVSGAFALGVLALPWIPDLQFMKSSVYPLAVAAALVFGACFWVGMRKPDLALPLLLLSFAIARLVFDVTVLPQRNQEGGAQRDRKLAQRIDKIVKDAPLYTAFQEKVVAYTTIVYLNQMRNRVVKRKDRLQKGDFYLIPLKRAPKNAEILLTTEYGDKLKALIRL
jgi:4-amino-4-deoxy-L-arabinose transferase-like glycosyltransferase